MAPTPPRANFSSQLMRGLRARAVFVVESSRDARAEDAILHFEIAELDRLEDRGVVHARLLVSVLAACQTSASNAGTMLCAGH